MDCALTKSIYYYYYYYYVQHFTECIILIVLQSSLCSALCRVHYAHCLAELIMFSTSQSTLRSLFPRVNDAYCFADYYYVLCSTGVDLYCVSCFIKCIRYQFLSTLPDIFFFCLLLQFCYELPPKLPYSLNCVLAHTPVVKKLLFFIENLKFMVVSAQMFIHLYFNYSTCWQLKISNCFPY